MKHATLAVIVIMIGSFGGAATGAPGDVNGDGKVDMDDARAVGRMSMGLEKPNLKYDIDGDGKITRADFEQMVELVNGGPRPTGESAAPIPSGWKPLPAGPDKEVSIPLPPNWKVQAHRADKTALIGEGLVIVTTWKRDNPVPAAVFERVETQRLKEAGAAPKTRRVCGLKAFTADLAGAATTGKKTLTRTLRLQCGRRIYHVDATILAGDKKAWAIVCRALAAIRIKTVATGKPEAKPESVSKWIDDPELIKAIAPPKPESVPVKDNVKAFGPVLARGDGLVSAGVNKALGREAAKVAALADALRHLGEKKIGRTVVRKETVTLLRGKWTIAGMNITSQSSVPTGATAVKRDVIEVSIPVEGARPRQIVIQNFSLISPAPGDCAGLAGAITDILRAGNLAAELTFTADGSTCRAAIRQLKPAGDSQSAAVAPPAGCRWLAGANKQYWIAVPKSWGPDKADPKKGMTTQISDKTGDSGLLVLCMNKPPENVKLAAFADELQKAVGAGIPLMKKHKAEKFDKVCDRTALIRDYSGKVDGQNILGTALFFYHNDKVYAVMGMVAEGKDKLAAQVSTALHSLRFTDPG